MPRKARKKSDERTLTRDSRACSVHSHRPDFRHCPHCDEVTEHEDWLKRARVLVIAVVYGKHGSIAVLSDCPKCFEKSWVHQDIQHVGRFMGELYGWPEEWTKAAEAEHSRRHLEGIRELDGSLCQSCAKLQTMEITTHVWRNCGAGCGGPLKECMAYERAKF